VKQHDAFVRRNDALPAQKGVAMKDGRPALHSVFIEAHEVPPPQSISPPAHAFLSATAAPIERPAYPALDNRAAWKGYIAAGDRRHRHACSDRYRTIVGGRPRGEDISQSPVDHRREGRCRSLYGRAAEEER